MRPPSSSTKCRDYLAPLAVPTLLRKISGGEIRLPLVRMGTSQKGAKCVHVEDLAAYIDVLRAAAVKESEQRYHRIRQLPIISARLMDFSLEQARVSVPQTERVAALGAEQDETNRPLH
ncbi:pyocin activator PrtN family protein [Trinickia sp. EG282A]|uniref:pyocin activator PrtN family protein n=1 Tax=Trinickia sp. EG282A TaxID=3237013 RepID=UPI0034D160D6